MYFYDFEMMDSDRPWDNLVSGVNNDPCRDDEAKKQVCRDIRLLDAYFYGDYEIGEMPFSVKVGQQIIGWGESTLISHGISEINPVDIARLKAPGAELVEAFIPFGAVFASLGVSENFSVEMFYQYDWEKTVLPAPGVAWQKKCGRLFEVNLLITCSAHSACHTLNIFGHSLGLLLSN